MLIYTSKYPGAGKHKPKQWGPLSAVRSSVFKNADHLGISPENIFTYLPLWELSGNRVHNLGNAGGDLISGGTGGFVWTTDGVILDTSNYLQSVDSLPAINPPFSCVMHFYQDVAWSNLSTSIANFMCSHSDGSDGWWTAQWKNYDSGLRLASNHGNIQYGQPSKGMHTIAIVQETADISSIYIDGVLVGSGDDGWLQGDAAPFRVGYNGKSSDLGSIGYTGFTWKSIAYVGQALSKETINVLHDSPYYLLQPVAKPIFFDVGAATTQSSTAATGQIAITGSAATGLRRLVSSAADSALAVTGYQATGTRELVSNASAANIAIKGFNTTSLSGLVSQASPGAVAVNGYPATGKRTLISKATVVQLAISGCAATGVKVEADTSTANAGTIAITGYQATDVRSLISSALPASIAVTGYPTTGTSKLTSVATQGTVAISGYPATGARHLVSSAAVGTLVIKGYNITSGGLGIICDTSIISLTPDRSVISVTPIRTAKRV